VECKSPALFVNLIRQLNSDKVPHQILQVSLIDVSGSMDLPNRLPLLKEVSLLVKKSAPKKEAGFNCGFGGSGIWWVWLA